MVIWLQYQGLVKCWTCSWAFSILGPLGLSFPDLGVPGLPVLKGSQKGGPEGEENDDGDDDDNGDDDDDDDGDNGNDKHFV